MTGTRFDDMAKIATVKPPKGMLNFTEYSDTLYEFKVRHPAVWGRPVGWRYVFRSDLPLTGDVVTAFLKDLREAMHALDERVRVDVPDSVPGPRCDRCDLGTCTNTDHFEARKRALTEAANRAGDRTVTFRRSL